MAFVIKFILVMFSMILADVCWTMYFIEVSKRKPIASGIWGSAIMIFGAFTTVHYVGDHRLLIAAVIGSFIGTAGTVYYKNKRENK